MGSSWKRRTALLAGGCATVVAGTAVTANAVQEIGNDMPNDFGYVSLTWGDQAQLNVANVGTETCVVTVRFLAPDGSAYTGPDMRPVPVEPDRGTTSTLDWRAVGVTAPGERVALRPVVDVAAARGRSGDGCEVLPTLEVFEQDTGRTAFVVPGSLVGFNPQPEPPARSRGR